MNPGSSHKQREDRAICDSNIHGPHLLRSECEALKEGKETWEAEA